MNWSNNKRKKSKYAIAIFAILCTMKFDAISKVFDWYAALFLAICVCFDVEWNAKKILNSQYISNSRGTKNLSSAK